MPSLQPRLRHALVRVGDLGCFLAEAGYWILPSRMRRRRARVPFPETLRQIDRIAFGMLPLLTIVILFVGMILALQLAGILQLLGVVEYVADIVGIAMVREMAPLLMGVVLSGYAGAAIAAEIGSMRVSEELTAMEALALQPSRYLVAPRILAGSLACPLITAVADYVGIAGGLLVSWMLLGMAPGQYLARTLSALKLEDIILGLTKGEVFGLIVVCVACFEGARTTGGAVGVGRSTTSAVVKSIVAIIAADLLLTMLFFQIH